MEHRHVPVQTARYARHCVEEERTVPEQDRDEDAGRVEDAAGRVKQPRVEHPVEIVQVPNQGHEICSRLNKVRQGFNLPLSASSSAASTVRTMDSSSWRER